MTDLVLVRTCLQNPVEKHWSTSPPLGLAYLASYARKNGLSVKVVDGKLEGHKSPEETAERILAYKPRYAGLTAMTVEFAAAVQIAGLLKSSKQPPVVIVGGAHANALPGQTLSETPDFDFVIAGEGESSLVNLIHDRMEYDQIPGLFWRDEDGAVRNSTPSCYDHDLSSMPFPAWDLFPRTDVYPVMTERGCPFKCVFCSHNMSRKVRRRSLEDVMAEIEWVSSTFKPSAIYFEDETFGLNPEHTMKLLARLIEFNRSAKLKFKAQTRVDMINEPLIDMMKEAGFEYLEMGVETGDPEILERSGKGFKLYQIEKAVQIVKKVGMKTWFKIIIGLPGETRDSIRRSMNFVVRHNPDRLSVATLVAYPGSDIYRWALDGKYGYKLITGNWSNYDKYLSHSLELENLSSRTMRRMQMQFYLEVYLKNRRFLELIKLLTSNFQMSKHLLKQLVSIKSIHVDS